MSEELAAFQKNMRFAHDLTGLYDALIATLTGAFYLEDLLRAHLVYTVSAFDKLMHDVIRHRMVDTFCGRRAPTSAYHAQPLTIEVYKRLATATIPPPEVVFEQVVVKKLSYLSFQEPNAVAKGLSLVWHHPHKWDAIADEMGMQTAYVRTRLKLIADRRNAIVHEADTDVTTGVRRSITREDVTTASAFIEKCAVAIVHVVA